MKFLKTNLTAAVMIFTNLPMQLFEGDTNFKRLIVHGKDNTVASLQIKVRKQSTESVTNYTAVSAHNTQS